MYTKDVEDMLAASAADLNGTEFWIGIPAVTFLFVNVLTCALLQG